MTAAITAAIDGIIKNHVAPSLKAEGFRRKGQRFWRSRNDAIELVELQRGKYNVDDSGEFTANLCLYFPRVVELAVGLPRFASLGPVTSSPAEQVCQFSTRLDELSEKGSWWQLDAQSNIPAVGSDFTSKLLGIGLPWLDARSELSACMLDLADWMARQHWYSAVYLLFAGVASGRLEASRLALPRVLESDYALDAKAKADLVNFARHHGLIGDQ